MTDGNARSRTSEWDWTQEGDLEIGGSLMFARGASPDHVIKAFGMDPAAAQLLPAARASEAIRMPVRNESLDMIYPWIRVGRTGDWAFAIDQGSAGYKAGDDEAAATLSQGTDVAWFMWTMTIDYFHYYVDGVEVTGFEPLGPQYRQGTDPDRFVEQMRQTGMDPDTGLQDDPVTGELLNSRICLLEMLTLALGIRLPREVALGPLLTVQRSLASIHRTPVCQTQVRHQVRRRLL
jgi:hypothetical protein